ATGLTFDLGHVLIGMVLPWFSMVGSFIGLLVGYVLNPILYHYHVLSSWTPGDGTIITNFKNYIDFYFSFGVGISLSIAAVGIVAVAKGLMMTRKMLSGQKNQETGGKGPLVHRHQAVAISKFAGSFSRISARPSFTSWYPCSSSAGITMGCWR
ncbi:MAG: hypothetical protein HC898_12915, partial [Phycisphaerales bacterium]|nr:hypothetical protein [Phycisphaerales bacterium]